MNKNNTKHLSNQQYSLFQHSLR